MVQTIIGERKTGTGEGQLEGKEAILAVLARAADDSEFLARLADNPAEALTEYYTLTQEELAALASGDIKKIEGWLGKLDKRHATWLWCRLSQEKW
jgi:predicted ATPase